ncbi:protein disulfide-isomerase TMX3-like [Ornithodoros turicata]|uniref:protein disulfide-isomerase TMX3-like n=1 Tax=Ornithodoros turicata TaxID=34597 RepID=UPI0031396C95
MGFTCALSLLLYSTTLCVHLTHGSKVLELSDRFLEVRHEGVWLVKFYAPWCSHCKMLEPIWSQVAQSLVDTDIRVGRVDCTRFTAVASEFGVRGFPTILFIKGHKTVEYKGDRNRDEIAEFGRRMDGPPVRHLTHCEDLQITRGRHKVFFLYVEGKIHGDGDGTLKDNFTRMAEEFQSQNYFFTIPPHCLAEVDGRTVPDSPAVLVFKDNSSFIYDEKAAEKQNINCYDWMNRERFPTFQKITYGNFYQMLKCGKKVVTAVLEENQVGAVSMKMEEFKHMLEAIALNTRDLYHEHFVFGWVGAPELANSVAMMNLPLPSLLVIKPDTYQYFLPEVEGREQPPSPQAVLELLNQILDGSAVPYGGDTFPYRLYRAYFEARTALLGMWKGNPVLTAVLFGLPLGFLSIICYTTCCCDILEASDEDEDIDESPHVKKE